jgi:hypothetical protein
MAPTMPPTVESVLSEELEQVERSRKLRLGQNSQRSSANKSLIGLAFSGGGIRSATFNLGILQALAQQKLLRAFDYVSTVSGGGYIGGWLMGWMHHQGIGIQDVEERLSAPPKAPRESADPPEVHFLRQYSNYLTPRKGVLGGDFWAFAAGYLRNTLLNQAILVLALLSLLLLPRTFVFVLHAFEEMEEALRGRFSDSVQTYMESQYFALEAGLILALVAVVFIGLNLVSVDLRKHGHDSKPLRRTARAKKKDCWFTNPWAVQALIVVPLLLAAAFFTYGLGQFLTEWQIVNHPLYSASWLGCRLYFAMWAVALLVRGIVRATVKNTGNGGPNVWLILATAAFTGAIAGYLFVPFARVLVPAGDGAGLAYSKWHAMTFGTPLTVGMILIAGVLHIGLMGRQMTDAHREWWGRLGGLLMIYAACWFFCFGIALYFPYGLGQLLSWEWHRHPYHPLTFTGVLVWIASTAYGVAFGKSDRSGKLLTDASGREKLLHYLAKAAPYVFLLGVLMGLSLLAALISNRIAGQGESVLALPSDWYFDWVVPAVCGLLFVAAVVLSWRVDINEFSIHYLYRNRLVRCYLGASVRERNPQPFTGFSDDNLPLAHLQIPAESANPKDARPLPIVNASLNVVRGKELALQTRKARSFAITPLYGGFTRRPLGQTAWESFFGPTKEAGCKRLGYENGITLGTSVAISGAAASPNMGFYSEPPLAFLMTLFDVRLGWWSGNPTRKQWQDGSPRVGFYWLLRELLGATTDDSDYVYLSDGGHFENLAIYELVRRRCKLIVACDASCDPDFDLADLHNAMERCRTDFGVEITLGDVAALKPTGPQGELRSRVHFVRGLIHYPDQEHGDGTIIYIKPTLVEGDPQDVLAYGKKNQHFPHDTTANQWFDEAHFENYRALGKAAGESAASQIADAIRNEIDYVAPSG